MFLFSGLACYNQLQLAISFLCSLPNISDLDVDLVMIPYGTSVSQDIRHVCRKFDTKVIFKFGRTLCLMLTKVKDTMPLKKQSNVVYKILCSCKKVYIGETKRRWETRIKDHQHASGKSLMGRSAIAEHAWKSHHPIKWEGYQWLTRHGEPRTWCWKKPYV